MAVFGLVHFSPPGPPISNSLRNLRRSCSKPKPGYHSQSWSVKRLIDIVGAAALLVFFLPLMLISAGLIRCCNGKGPIFFKQTRIGRHGAAFGCIKFRTMSVEADLLLGELLERDPMARAEWAASRKLTDDPRITPLGKLLRSTSIDELPQLWNVIRGDMSLVGPRPVTQAEVEGPYTVYGAREHYLAVRPGMTGAWQVSGRSDTSYETRIRLDSDYVRNISFSRDIAILCRTVSVVLGCRGAY